MVHNGSGELEEPVEWETLHVGAERGVNCEHMQALVTNIFQRHCEWQEDRRTDLQPRLCRYNTAFSMASLDVDTAFDVATPSVVSKILTLTGVHGPLTAALLSETQDVRGSACSENSETGFRHSRCIRHGGVEALVLWGCVTKYVFWKADEKWKAKGWRLPFDGQTTLNMCCLAWWELTTAGYCATTKRDWYVVNDFIDELLDLDMEPKPQSLWWTCTERGEDTTMLRGNTWDLPFCEVFEVLGYRYHRGVNGFQGAAGQVHVPLEDGAHVD